MAVFLQGVIRNLLVVCSENIAEHTLFWPRPSRKKQMTTKNSSASVAKQTSFHYVHLPALFFVNVEEKDVRHSAIKE